MFNRSPRSAVILTALPLLLAGCAAGAAGSDPGADAQPSARESVQTSTATPQVSATPLLDSANTRPLPLDPYLLSPVQRSTVEKAQQRLIVSCMAPFGLTYTPPAAAQRPRDSDAPTSRVDARYGHQNAELMAKWGYHSEGGNPAGSDARPSGPTMTPQAEVALRGASDPKERFGPGGQVVNGRKVPDHGCIGQTDKQLTGTVDGEVGDAEFADDIKFRTLDAAQHDRRTQAVFGQWSQCMKDAGFGYADPLAALGDPQWRQTPMPTEHELQVATADAACRHKHNVVGVWYAVDAAYQQQAIADNAAAMARVKAGLDAQVKAATQFLGP